MRKNVLGHFNGGPVVGDHLDDEVVRNAAIQCGPGHSCDHPVQDAAIGPADIPWNLSSMDKTCAYVVTSMPYYADLEEIASDEATPCCLIAAGFSFS